jgi:DNA-binding PucR family transcriptional regulator
VIAAVLTPVEKYDAANNSSLMSTLGAYFDASFNLTGAAATLFVRPNTVMYRLKRVGELTGRNPFDPNDLLLLVLAWKLRSVGARDRAIAA